MSEADQATLLADHRPPPWPPGRGEDPAPDGYHWEWAVTDSRWQVYPYNARRCRYTVGPDRRSCKRPAVATLDRAWSGKRPNLWGYCEDHLYGRTLHDGAIWSVVLRPDSTQGAPGV